MTIYTCICPCVDVSNEACMKCIHAVKHELDDTCDHECGHGEGCMCKILEPEAK